MDYQYKKKEYEKKEEKKGFEEEIKGKECPNCHTINDLEARFCANCGYDFSGARRCPKCGAKIVSPNADICEVCGEWLLEGKCKFCYADLEEGATYCPECGNPVAGIVCPKCGKLSYFDFCPNCNTPLTTTAKNMLEEMKSDPQKQKILQAFKDYEKGLIAPEKMNEILADMKDLKFSSNQEARRFFMALCPPDVFEKHKEIATEEQELLKMKEYIETVEKKDKKKKTFPPLFSEKQKESIKEMEKIASEEIKRQEEERRRKEEEERRKQEEERRRQEEEERKKREEEKRRRRIKGWICNAFGVFHPGGPAECEDPSKGGYWVVG